METLHTLLEEYNSLKDQSTSAAKSITSLKTLRGMDEINEMVANGMKEIAQFTETGEEGGFISNTGSKALAIIDPNSSWIGKWMGKAKERAQEAELKSKSISEITDNLKQALESKRDEVIDYIQKLRELGTFLHSSLDQYESIETRGLEIVESAEPNSRESYDGKRLVTWVRTTIIDIRADLGRCKDLITAADITVNELDVTLPAITEKLNSKLGIKTVQQQLSDLHGMAKSITALSEAVNSKLVTDINNTIVDSLEMLKGTSGAIKAIETQSRIESAHREKVGKLMHDVKKRVDEDFVKVETLVNAIEYKKDDDILMLGTVKAD